MSPLMSPAELRPRRHLAHFAKARLQLPGLLEECRALAARKIPYVYGGTSDDGMDCSASVQRLFRNRGISLPRTSEGQANTLARRGQLWRVAAGESELDVFKRLKPGELLFWVKNESPNRVSHVMVFVGMDGKKPNFGEHVAQARQGYPAAASTSSTTAQAYASEAGSWLTEHRVHKQPWRATTISLWCLRKCPEQSSLGQRSRSRTSLDRAG